MTEVEITPQADDHYKLRAGDYRAIITWDRDEDVLIVEAVGHRRNVYDRHLPP
jgi:mRNA interferase RelE/StbE